MANKKFGETSFSDEEILAIQRACDEVWTYCAYDDVLQSVADEKHKPVDSVTVSRAVVMEIAIDAGRCEERLLRRQVDDTKYGKTPVVTDDLMARWDTLDYKAKCKLIKPRFSFTRYGT